MDYALLEQKKAQMQSTDAVADDEALEEAFQTAAAAVADPSSSSTVVVVPKKRSRNDIITELKGKHAAMDEEVVAAPPPTPEVAALEKAKQMGKFRPIGAPAAEGKAKEEKRKKKKRKVVEAEPIKANAAPSTAKAAAPDAPAPTTSSLQPLKAKITPPETEVRPPAPSALADAEPAEDVDIFADAGEYEGLDLGDEDDDDDANQPPQPARPAPSDNKEEGGGAPVRRANWFNEPSPEPLEQGPPPRAVASPGTRTKPGMEEGEQGDQGQREVVPTRLAPLASSSIADVKAFLAMDKALEKEEKRKARKEKNKKKDA